MLVGEERLQPTDLLVPALGQPRVGTVGAFEAAFRQTVPDEDEFTLRDDLQAARLRFVAQCPPPTYSAAIASASTSDTSPAKDTLPRLSR